ncbi:hypothetical protein [Halorussus lipolyticus]|uniref:hypothetical protein n=1 Tax=Halorussus lipolyticus TaxID=3034024 RepID=UPI0023E86D40|nr:hypothetical protein [Halorussus sp. DT80]
MVPRPSRREMLGLAGVGATAIFAGCSGFTSSNGARYSLQSSPRGGTSLLELFRWKPRRQALHVRRHADELVATLLDAGELTTEAQPLGPYDPSETPPPAYVEHEDAYYRVRVTDVESVSLDRWEFWLEPVERAPPEATVVDAPVEGLSKLDAEIVERATQDAIGAVVSDEDLSAADHGERGVVYFDPMGPDESQLVPNPPFEYVRVDPDTEFLDEKQTLRAHAAKGSVKTKRYVHETERVADSRSELLEILRSHLDATLDDVEGDVRDIVTEISVGNGIYTEREPISDALTDLLERLGVDSPSPPDSNRGVRRWRRHYEYDGGYYRTTLRIRND